MLRMNPSMQYLKVPLLATLNSLSVTSQTLASVACYVSKQVDFSKLTVVELNGRDSQSHETDAHYENKLSKNIRPTEIQ